MGRHLLFNSIRGLKVITHWEVTSALACKRDQTHYRPEREAVSSGMHRSPLSEITTVATSGSLPQQGLNLF